MRAGAAPRKLAARVTALLAMCVLQLITLSFGFSDASLQDLLCKTEPLKINVELMYEIIRQFNPDLVVIFFFFFHICQKRFYN